MIKIKAEVQQREGSIERGDSPLEIKRSCRIGNKIYHAIQFKSPELTERIYSSQKLQVIAPVMLINYYESLIQWD